MALLDRLTGAIASFGIGAASADAITPVLETAKQEAWGQRAVRVLSVTQAAEADAIGLDGAVNYADDAKRQGIGAERYRLLVELTKNAPGTADLFTLHRRKEISDAQLEEGLLRAHLDPEWRAKMLKLLAARLSPDEMANAVQQGFVPNADLLPGAPPGPPFAIPFDQIDLNTLQEFADFGFDSDRARVKAQLVGLPPGPVELAGMVLRKLIPKDSFYVGVREGHTKTKWGPALFDYLTRRILTPANYVGARLRGWIDDAAMYEGAALSGLNREDTHLLFLSQGRPATGQQVFEGLLRGGEYDGPTDTIAPSFLKSLQESDLRPEWYNLLWHRRFAYPSLFQLNRLVQGEAIDVATGADWARKVRLAPEVVTALVAYWRKGSVAKVKELTATQLDAEYEGFHISELEYRAALAGLGYPTEQQDLLVFIGDAKRIGKYRDKATARFNLAEIPVADEAIDELLRLWTLDLTIAVKQLTQAQIRAAYRKTVLTLDAALAELEERGLSDADARVYLAT